MEIGNVISCKYNGRKVRGEIVRLDKTWIVVKLHNEYIGKNEEWGIGEKKVLSRKICKNSIKIIK